MCDAFGDRLKRFEMAEAGRYMMDGLPVVARLDGRAFHTFTRGMKRPFDPKLMECMEYTAKALVEEFHADIGYTQSDEITLAWRDVTMFGGRYQKYQSVLAGFCSAAFHMKAAWTLDPLPNGRPGDRYGFPKVQCFDCRVFQLPSRQDVLDVLAWREDDAVKNSIQMAAQSVYSHKELHGKNRHEQMDMLHAKGINWNDYPVHFKRGIYLQRVVEERPLTPEELAKVPEKHRANLEGKLVKRSRVDVLPLLPIREVAGDCNIEDIIFRPKEQK